MATLAMLHHDGATKETACIKAVCEIRAGLAPGEPIPVHTKRFWYTQDMYDRDSERLVEQLPSELETMQNIALGYALGLMRDRELFWVVVSWCWY